MIARGENEVMALYRGERPVTEVYRGEQLVWQRPVEENMLSGTRAFTGNWLYADYWSTDENQGLDGLKVLRRTGDWGGIRQPVEVIAGEDYTFSLFVKSDGEGEVYIFTDGDSAVVTPPTMLRIFPSADKWTRFAFSFHCESSGLVVPRAECASPDQTIWIAGYKLEKGKVTDTVWTPAPGEE